jgi:hypothetical protein
VESLRNPVVSLTGRARGGATLPESGGCLGDVFDGSPARPVTLRTARLAALSAFSVPGQAAKPGLGVVFDPSTQILLGTESAAVPLSELAPVFVAT